MKQTKFTMFNDNDTNCSYVTILWKNDLQNKVKELISQYNKINGNVEVEINLKDLYIYHFEYFEATKHCDKSFLGYDGENYYVQLYFYPVDIDDSTVIDELASISFDIEHTEIKNSIEQLEMVEQESIS